MADPQFQTSVLRDGQWVTETVSVQSVAQSINAAPVKKQRMLRPPTCGLLSKTVVGTQLAHQILPVRLRSLHHADVAFVGDNYVQIRELRRDGQLQDIIRRDNFESRIRNATVLGNLPADLKNVARGNPPGPPIKAEDDDDVIMDDNDDGNSDTTSQNYQSALPPQMLLLHLDNGDTIFLYLRTQPDGMLEFAYSQYGRPSSVISYYGHDVAIDPSSRFLAIAGREKYFAIHELNSMQRLDEQAQRGEQLTPVASHVVRSVQGVIVKMQFLYPRFGDDTHVIFLVIVADNGRSRMVTYEWTLGDNIKTVFSVEKRGTLMPVEHQLPVLLIPLKVSTAFIVVSETRMTTCTGLLHGSPTWEDFSLDDRPVTANYHGRSQPLWTAWARPYRLPHYSQQGKDCIFLAREDGVVHFMELEADSTVSSSIYMDRFDCNINTAFACLWDETADLLVIGGDSGPGGVWKIPPRDKFIKLTTLPNWSPVVDFATTDEFKSWNQDVGVAGTQMVRWQDKVPSKPDRIFSTSGRGTKGTVTEYRYGLQANIGLETECDPGAKQSWLLPWTSEDSTGYHLLWSMPGQTAVACLNDDFSQTEETDNTPIFQYDDSSQTLAAAESGSYHMVIQVTEKFIVLTGDGFCSRIPFSRFERTSNTSVMDAAICDNYIAVSTYSDSQFMIHILRVNDPANSAIAFVQSFFVADAEVNCLSLSLFNDQTVELLAGLWQGTRPLVARARIGGDRLDDLEKFDPYSFSLLPVDQTDSSPTGLEPIDSIASCVHADGQVIVTGFRHGEVVVISLDQTGILRWVTSEKVGLAAAKVAVASEPGAKPMVLVSVDRELLLMVNLDAPLPSKTGVVGVRHRIWPVDASNMGAQTPGVDSVMVLPKNVLSDRDDTVSMILLSGSRILFTEMQLLPGPAHRHIPVVGTPTRIIYSHHWKCLIVAVTRKNRPALMFLDPDTGEDLGTPRLRKGGPPQKYIAGLGKEGEKILSLAEWEYKQNNSVWRWLLVTVSAPTTPTAGKLAIVSVEADETPANSTKKAGISYWTQFRIKGLAYPVCAAIGFQDFIIYCTGHTLVWCVIDSQDRKIVVVDKWELESPAESLQMVNGKLLVLTIKHGLQVLEPPQMSGVEKTAPCKSLHNDPRYTSGMHMIEVGATEAHEPMMSVVLVSDRSCGISGLWIPWQVPDKDPELVFDAELSVSIRAFRRGRTRPFWEQRNHKPRYGRIAMTTDDAEILGVCMDGSMQQFSLLNTDIWRLLRFMQNMAMTSKEICPYSYVLSRIGSMADFEPEPELRADQMHVDGDVLQRVYDKRALERLMDLPTHLSRFKELLQELDEGEHTMDMKVEGPDADAQFLELAYAILEDFLAPAL